MTKVNKGDESPIVKKMAEGLIDAVVAIGVVATKEKYFCSTTEALYFAAGAIDDEEAQKIVLSMIHKDSFHSLVEESEREVEEEEEKF